MGDKHPAAKPLRGFGGAGVLEVVGDHAGNTCRAVYTVRFARVRGIRTPKHPIDLIESRLKWAQLDYDGWAKGAQR